MVGMIYTFKSHAGQFIDRPQRSHHEHIYTASNIHIQDRSHSRHGIYPQHRSKAGMVYTDSIGYTVGIVQTNSVGHMTTVFVILNIGHMAAIIYTHSIGHSRV